MKHFDPSSIEDSITVLYVEDDDDIRDVMLEILPLLATKVIGAEDGRQGLDAYAKNTIDIIITDINMPNMDGMEMIKEIRKLNEDIPIIITSAFNSNDYLIEAISLGVEHYLLKPIVMTQLEAKLKRVKKYIMQQRELKAYQNYLEDRVIEEVTLREVKEKLLLSQNKDAELGKMVSIIAHQWKQPLHYLNLLIEDIVYEYEDNGLSQDFVNSFVTKSTERIRFLSDTMDNFLRFYKNDATVQRFSVEKVVHEVGFFLSVLFKAVGVKLEIKIHQNFYLKGVENEFQQVVLNLLNNAKEAFKDLKKVDAKICISLDVKNGQALMQISDNAKGIPEDKINAIFDKDYTTKSGGNGIGLYLVKKIVYEHFLGSINVYNQIEGVCFELSFSPDIKDDNE